MYHRIEMIGRLGKEPELRYTPTGEMVCEISVATDHYKGANKVTVWFKVTVWGEMAKIAAESLHKGNLVYVHGRLIPDDTGNPRAYKRKNGDPAANYEVIASKVLFLSPKDKPAYDDTDDDIF